jgi:hypothetical protein
VDEEVDVEGLAAPERVEVRRGRVREERHVGLVDRLEAAVKYYYSYTSDPFS